MFGWCGVDQSTGAAIEDMRCPTCEILRLRAEIEEARKARDLAEAKTRWIESTSASKDAQQLAWNLPPDILMGPLPLPPRIDYAAKLIQHAFNQWAQQTRETAAGLEAKYDEARETIADVLREMKAARSQRDQLATSHAEARKALGDLAAKWREEIQSNQPHVRFVKRQCLAELIAATDGARGGEGEG